MSNLFARIAKPFIAPAAAADSAGLRLVFDVEADALLDAATKTHCIVVADLDSDQVHAYGPEQIGDALAHLARADCLIGHNIGGYDLPLLLRLHGWAPASGCVILDTLIASRLILPHVSDLDDQAGAMGAPRLGKLRGRYSLEAWGIRLGIPKIGADITDWSQWTPEMQERCGGDVAICKALWRFLQPDGYSQEAMTLEHRVAAVCDRISADGVPFDSAAAEQLREQWTAQRAALAAQLSQQFPGTNLNSRPQIGALLEARGWVPESRTEKTGAPKISDELLESLPSLYPEFAGLAEYAVLGRRIAQLATGKQAWIKHVDATGRIHGGLMHIGTPHSRAKHMTPNLAQVPNPRKGKPFAAECRALFRASDDWAFVTADQAGLQDRGFAHYLAEFDAGAYAETFSWDAHDTHWQTVLALGLIAEGTVRNTQSKVHTAIREGAKSFRYAFLYGVGAMTAGRIISDTARAAAHVDSANDLQQRLFNGTAYPNEIALKRVGKRALNKFINATPGLAQLRESLEAHVRQHSWLPGLDGRRVPVRALYTALNYQVTSSEAIVCKRWLVQVYDELCARFRYGWDGDVVITLWVHDEIACCCRPEIAAEVGEILARHAKAAGVPYGFKVPLDADYKTGQSWAGEPISMEVRGNDALEEILDLDDASDDPDTDQDADDQDLDEDEAPAAGPTVAEQVHLEELERGFHAFRVDIEAMMQAPPEPAPRTNGAAGKGNGQAHGAVTQDAHAVNGVRSDSGAGDNDHEHAGKPYGPIRAALRSKGYSLARSFEFMVPGESAPLFYEDRFELNFAITPSKTLPRKECRFHHLCDGQELSGTGPRRIIYGWPAILHAGPGAEIFITEGANKSEPLCKAGLLATAVPYHKWTPECISALAGANLIYLEDHDHPDEKGRIRAKQYSADARTKLVAGASFRIVPALHLWKNLGHSGEPPHGWDVKNWIEAGGNPARLPELCRGIAVAGAKPRIAPIREWDGKPAPEIMYGVPDRFPLEVISLFSGEGGGGKSTATQQLAVAHALEREWLGSIPRKGPAIYVECEDPEKVLHWRQKAIAEHYGVTQAVIADAGFYMLPLADGEESAILATAPDKRGIIHPTPLYDQLYEMAGDIKPVMIGIASAAIVFAGNENVRPEVQQFMWLLRRLTRVSGGYVLLITQPSLTGIGDASVSHAGLSGTTQWHNGSRGRAVLRAVKPEGGGADTGLREIKFYKNQYGALSASCFVRYTNGLFLPVDGMSMDGAEQAARAEGVFVALLKKFTAQHQVVSHATGRNYAPSRFAEQPEALGITRKEFVLAMQRLLDAKVIEIRTWGKPSRPGYFLALAGGG
jgi:DNA polymerase-1